MCDTAMRCSRAWRTRSESDIEERALSQCLEPGGLEVRVALKRALSQCLEPGGLEVRVALKRALSQCLGPSSCARKHVIQNGNSHKGSFMNLEGGKHVLRLKQVIDPVYPVKKECVPPEYFILST
ncbi:hypothetical protein C0Q70_04390 [Pomacea canaliculata]|uniref:Uncharacterized protein n=1 Tax=Pomacea canaliculata TaxID=400727 RepID=A0A2T7PVE5_POMCA|nr:hypothetical protein C0Q70_04390 [Pomacea canaliculata]